MKKLLLILLIVMSLGKLYAIPNEVLWQMQSDLTEYYGSGYSVTETSGAYFSFVNLGGKLCMHKVSEYQIFAPQMIGSYGAGSTAWRESIDAFIPDQGIGMVHQIFEHGGGNTAVWYETASGCGPNNFTWIPGCDYSTPHTDNLSFHTYSIYWTGSVYYLTTDGTLEATYSSGVNNITSLEWLNICDNTGRDDEQYVCNWDIKFGAAAGTPFATFTPTSGVPPTSTPNATQTFVAGQTQTQQAVLTLTATQWTLTPTLTYTPTITPTPTPGCPTILCQTSSLPGALNYGNYDPYSNSYFELTGGYIGQYSAIDCSLTHYLASSDTLLCSISDNSGNEYIGNFDHYATVYKYNIATNTITQTLKFSPSGFSDGGVQDLIYDNGFLYVADADSGSSGYIYKYNIAGNYNALTISGQNNVNGLSEYADIYGKKWILGACSGFWTKCNVTTGAYTQYTDNENTYRICNDGQYLYTANWEAGVDGFVQKWQLDDGSLITQWRATGSINSIQYANGAVYTADQTGTLAVSDTFGNLECTYPSTASSAVEIGGGYVWGETLAQVSKLGIADLPTITVTQTATPTMTPTFTPTPLLNAAINCGNASATAVCGGLTYQADNQLTWHYNYTDPTDLGSFLSTTQTVTGGGCNNYINSQNVSSVLNSGLTYCITMTAGVRYNVTLDWAGFSDYGARINGGSKQNVYINNILVMYGFSVFSRSIGYNTFFSQSFLTYPDANNLIYVTLLPVSGQANAYINGISVVQGVATNTVTVTNTAHNTFTATITPTYTCTVTKTYTITPTFTITPTPTPAIYFFRVACGNSSNVSAYGTTWHLDKSYYSGHDYGYITSQPFPFYTNNTIVNTPYSNLYQHLNSCNNEMDYEFNLPMSGLYRINIKWADFISTGAGQHVMNVSANGTAITNLQNIDVFSLAGSGAALDYVVYVAYTYTSSPFELSFISVHGNPFVNAISIESIDPNQIYIKHIKIGTAYLNNAGLPQ